MPWKRPKTIKLYLSPPEAKRLITVWPDFKIINKAVDNKEGGPDDDFGIHFVFGARAQALNWRKTGFRVRADGLPVHTLLGKHEGFSLELESFCDFGAEPRTFIKLLVKNGPESKKTYKFGLMARQYKANLLNGLSGDFYDSYFPMLEQWDMAKNLWTLKNNCLEGGRKSIAFLAPAGTGVKWVPKNKRNIFAKTYAEFTANFDRNEPKEYYFLLTNTGPENISGYEYAAKRKEMVAGWEQELAKLTVRPKTNDKKIQAMYNSLVCQCLQMFAVANDGLIRPRQGAQNKGVWSVEACEFLIALDRIGLGSWSKKGYEFFSHYRIKKGKDRGKFFAAGAPDWMCYTAGVMTGLAYHLGQRASGEYFKKWRNLALESVNWAERQRNLTKKDKNIPGYGLLPAGKGNDWGIVGQYWSFTDGLMYMGMRDMAKVFKKFKDPLAGRMQRRAEDYEACLKLALKKLVAPQKGKKEYFLPNILGIEDVYPPLGPYFADGPTNLIRAGIIRPGGDICRKVENYFFNRGWMKNGLTGLMTDSFIQNDFFQDKWSGHTWYVSYSDMIWFSAWLKQGERKKAEKTLKAQFKYAMTPEYYMQERYADNDPAFCPWQPNASANGRTLRMLLDFYGEKIIK